MNNKSAMTVVNCDQTTIVSDVGRRSDRCWSGAAGLHLSRVVRCCPSPSFSLPPSGDLVPICRRRGWDGLSNLQSHCSCLWPKRKGDDLQGRTSLPSPNSTSSLTILNLLLWTTPQWTAALRSPPNALERGRPLLCPNCLTEKGGTDV